MYSAIEYNNEPLMRWMIQQGFPVNNVDLLVAITRSDMPLLQSALDLGVPLTEDSANAWALKMASVGEATSEQESVLRLLLNAQSHTQRQLMEAAKMAVGRSNVPLMKLLIQAGLSRPSTLLPYYRRACQQRQMTPDPEMLAAIEGAELRQATAHLTTEDATRPRPRL